MSRSFWPPVRVLAGLLAVAAACAACGGGPAKVSVKAAAANPCLLLSQSQARAIMGGGTQKPLLTSQGGCQYTTQPDAAELTPGEDNVNLSFNLGTSASMALLTYVIAHPAPVPSVGHDARCGAVKDNPTVFDLIAAVSRRDQLVVIGASCALDARFARQALSRL